MGKWKGYTLDEIRQQKAQLREQLQPKPAPIAQMPDAGMSYIDYAMMTYNITKRIIGYFRNRRR